MLLSADCVGVSLPAKSLQEFATVLRNLEDERMRMVRPHLPGAGWVVALLLPLAALRTVGGVAPGAPWRAVEALVPLPSPRAELQGRAEGGERELGGGGGHA